MTNGARVVLGVIVVLGGLVAIVAPRYLRASDWTICQQMYQAARSPAESLAVDIAVARRNRSRGEYAGAIAACGELRKLNSPRPSAP